MTISSIAGGNLVSAYERFGQAANRVSRAVTPMEDGGGGDLPSALVELNEAKIDTQANVKVVKAAREMEQNLLDLFA